MRRFWLACPASFAAILLLIGFVDRPVARLAHDNPSYPTILIAFTHIPEAIGVLSVLSVIVFALWQAQRGNVPRIGQTMLLAGVSVIVAEAIKTGLKLAFGRSWPETWVNHNLSYIKDGVYGFFPFHGGKEFAAFPSGHTTVVAAAMVVLWIREPRWRALYAAVIAATAIGLVGMDYHFASDILAGFCLGTATAWITVRIATPANNSGVYR